MEKTLEQRVENAENDHREQQVAFITIQGQQVFTARFAFEQMQATNSRIDRALSIALASLCVAIVEAIILTIMLIR